MDLFFLEASATQSESQSATDSTRMRLHVFFFSAAEQSRVAGGPIVCAFFVLFLYFLAASTQSESQTDSLTGMRLHEVPMRLAGHDLAQKRREHRESRRKESKYEPVSCGQRLLWALVRGLKLN